jgi:hypothetical protein
MYISVHRVIPTRTHGLTYFVHKQLGCIFGYPVTDTHIAGRQALGTSRHLKTDKKSLPNPELYFMEQRIGGGRLGITATVTGMGIVFSYLALDMTTFPAFKPIRKSNL